MSKALIPVDGYVRVSRVGAGAATRSSRPSYSGRASSESQSAGAARRQVVRRAECFGRRLGAPTVERGDRARRGRGRPARLRGGQLDKLSRSIRFVIAEDERDRASAGFRAALSNAISRGI